MRRPVEIREIRHDDLRGVYLLGEEILQPDTDAPLPWNPETLAGVMAGNMCHSFVAAGKKTIDGFLIGSIADDSSALILWIGARGREQDRVREDLCNAFMKSLPPSVTRIKIFLDPSRGEMADFFGKFGFTLVKHVAIMENFFRKKP